MIKTLWDLLKGEQCLVEGFRDDLKSEYSKRLFELGFSPGAEVTCTLAPNFGFPKLYRVNNTIYSLDNDIAELVDVRIQK